MTLLRSAWLARLNVRHHVHPMGMHGLPRGTLSAPLACCDQCSRELHQSAICHRSSNSFKVDNTVHTGMLALQHLKLANLDWHEQRGFLRAQQQQPEARICVKMDDSLCESSG